MRLERWIFPLEIMIWFIREIVHTIKMRDKRGGGRGGGGGGGATVFDTKELKNNVNTKSNKKDKR